jgi:hypothetical protein
MSPALPDLPVVEAAVVEMTNAFRTSNKLRAVAPNDTLTKAARNYAALLAKMDAFSHTADGRQAGDRVTSTGYQWCTVAENLAMHLDSRGFESRDLARKSVEGWINSPSHKANLLAPHVTEVGVGVARAPGKDPKFISVQLFARPRALEYTFQISNSSKVPVTYAFGGETHEVEPHMAVTHTACMPDAVVFEKAGGRSVASRFAAADGTVYTLKPDPSLGVTVELSARETAK